MNTWELFSLHARIFAAVVLITFAVLVVRNAVVLLIVPAFRGLRQRILHRSPGMPFSLRLLPVALLVLSLPSQTNAADIWASFQNGGSLSLSGKSDRAGGNSSKQADWSSEITGYGQSSPVVWQDRVYVTSVSGEMKENYHVSAFHLNDGTKLWQHDLKNPAPRENNNYVSLAAPTPAVDRHGLICFFEEGNLVALSHKGEVRWERNLVEEFGANDARHGLAASVEQNAETAFVWVERGSDPYVLCVDKSTGKTVWKVAGIGATSWASPRLIPVADGFHLVLSGSGNLTGLDPKTGDRLWTFDGISGNTTPTPIPVASGRFLVGATVGRGGGDTGQAAASNGLIELTRDGKGAWKAGYVWHAQRATSSFGSPVAHRGLAYFVNRTGVLYALDLDSGKEVFAERIGESIWATPIGLENQVMLFRRDGVVKTIVAGADFRSLSEKDLFPKRDRAANPSPTARTGPILYAAVIVGGKALIRSGDRLVCFRLGSQPGGQSE